MSARLRLAGVGCVRGGRALFTGVDLDLAPGDALAVTGPNGAGKTSLLRLVAGLLPAQAGSIESAGRMAFAGEQAALDSERPLAKALRYWARIDGGGDADVARALEAMGLGHLSEVPVRLLSAGQRKRASLARVIAGSAEIWLLDEPANGLDTDSRERLEAAIAAHRSGGGIALVATHQPVAMAGARELAIGDSE